MWARRWLGALTAVVLLGGCGQDDTPEEGLVAFNAGRFSEAKALWSQQAAAGNALSQYYLGRMYELGLGVPQDFDVAAPWYRKAAEQSNPYAQGNLAVLYAHGRGVPQDFVRSYLWSTLSAAGHASWAQELKELALKNRGVVATRMSAEELGEARRLVEQYQERAYPKPPERNDSAAKP